jgi:hypothetical protein
VIKEDSYPMCAGFLQVWFIIVEGNFIVQFLFMFCTSLSSIAYSRLRSNISTSYKQNTFTELLTCKDDGVADLQWRCK